MKRTVETVENRIDIHLPEDLSKITAKTRRSIYFLQSLETFFREHVVSGKFYNPDFLTENKKLIDNYFEKFEELETKIYFPKKSQVQENGMHKLDFDIIELSKIAVEYLELKENIDNLQLEILKYLFKVENDLMLKISNKEKYLQDLVMQESGNAFLFSAFKHSENEDKLDNYRIHISDEKSVKKFSKKNTYPIPLKVRNYDYLLDKHRKLYKIIRNAQIQVLTNSSKLREEEEMRKMNIEQFELNKKVNNLTKITTVLGIIGFIYATLSIYFQATDKSLDILKTNGIKTEKVESILEIIKVDIKENNSTIKKEIEVLEEIKTELKTQNKELDKEKSK